MKTLGTAALTFLLLLGLPAEGAAQAGATRLAVTAGYDMVGSNLENGFSFEALGGYRWPGGFALSGGVAGKMLKQRDAVPAVGGVTEAVSETEVDLLSVFGQVAYWSGGTERDAPRWRSFAGARVGHVRFLEDTADEGGLEAGVLGGVEYELSDRFAIRFSGILTYLAMGRGIEDGVRARVQGGVGVSL